MDATFEVVPISSNKYLDGIIVIFWLPFVVSLSNHERPFDKLRANGGRLLKKYENNFVQVLIRWTPPRRWRPSQVPMKNIQAIGTTIIQELERTLSGVENEQAEKLTNAILESEKVFVAGAGRSGFMVKAFAMRLMHMGIETYVVGETTTPNVTIDDVLIIASGSGATSSLIVMAQKAKAIGAQIGLVTIDHQSPIAELADIVLVIPAPSPKIERETGLRSIQPMGSLFEQSLLLTLDAMILMLMEKRGKTSDIMFTRHANLE